MTVAVEQRGVVFRIIDQDTGDVAVHSVTGNELDGGGHEDPSKAERQAGYVNAALDKRRMEGER